MRGEKKHPWLGPLEPERCIVTSPPGDSAQAIGVRCLWTASEMQEGMPEVRLPMLLILFHGSTVHYLLKFLLLE